MFVKYLKLCLQKSKKNKCEKYNKTELIVDKKHINILGQNMELSFNNLRCKDVINICDGKNLGQITDIIIDSCGGRIIGIVVPYSKNFFSFASFDNSQYLQFEIAVRNGSELRKALAPAILTFRSSGLSGWKYF